LAIGEIQPWTYTYRPRGEYGLEEESSQLIKAVLPRPLGASLEGIVSLKKRVQIDRYKTYYGEYYLYNWAIRGGPEISEKKVTAQVVCYVTKQWVRNGHSLKNWLLAVMIVFSKHYILSFI
jgi:hypothetical protein